MSAIEFKIDDTSNRVVLHLEKMPLEIRTNLRATIVKLTNELLGQVRSREPVRTGLLRSSTQSFVSSGEDKIIGRVRIRPTGRQQRIAAAFGALEYGAHRSFEVRSYRRGRSIVAAYERTANIQARRFLRGPLAEMRSQIIAELEASLQKSVE